MKTVNVKYPFASCKMVGENGNVFAVIGRVTSALAKTKVLSKEEVDQIRDDLFNAGSYDDVLCMVMELVIIDPSPRDQRKVDAALRKALAEKELRASDDEDDEEDEDLDEEDEDEEDDWDDEEDDEEDYDEDEDEDDKDGDNGGL